MNNYKGKQWWLAAALAQCMLTTSVWAAVSAEEAAALGTTLTPIGAERAGNETGTIPEWTGGFTGKPEGHRVGKMDIEPFPNEQPVLVINAENLDQYRDNLSQSVQRLIETQADFRLDVYPTHRTASAPQWFYDYTAKNALSAQLSNGVKSLTGAYGGTPFPIPKNGGEVLWNHFLSWKGSAVEQEVSMYMIDGNGRQSLSSSIHIHDMYRYHLPGGEADFDGFWQWHRALTTAPGRSAGEALVGIWPVDFQRHQPGSWQYMPGQRRVRKLPNVQFDTPNFYVSGMMQFDEAYGFFGSPEQYDWQLISKKEMYVPYNTNKLLTVSPKEAYQPGIVNPDAVRWELHRVWEVEGVLKEGVRNTVPRRRLYMDEDSWNIILADLWDSQDQLYRGAIAYTGINYDLPGVLALPIKTMDHQQGTYVVGSVIDHYTPVTPQPRSFFTAEALVQDALR
ncbi:DUF1329 domain-containing protein [Pseudomonas sp. FME51]|uniref:DUF1329 domain-containing protein n=1 Tax=Pseudomonas sp. FME51 TaxID=2742609 RepID=UPI0018695398|nr:DUF1329 domain-containing protein [Pseudomonas sp. FME51]